ncbi:DUF6297 family protein [Cellulomonas soli]|uniref:Uncharacterized protein n=1 Tax=Cellulomonas soli TaxID=931535 RepID=A0A512PDN8_9CELL|nr:DUF6297 family protein [Cellulomonas soli]NYI60027.1 hypothetical protein [Cellulomonas soli]GEP69319.1 hypothetical protein CSO01_20340 [Cellulomonas soli]
MTADVDLVGPDEVGQIPAARSIRRYTTGAANARSGAQLGTVLQDVYYAIITLAISVAIALGLAQQLRVSLPPAPDVVAPRGLSLPTLVTVVIVGLVGVLLSLAGRLGPIGAGGAEATWWLGLPVDRRGLLRPAARRLPALAALVGAVLVALLDAGLLADSPARVVQVAVTSGLVAAAVVLLAGLAQSLGVARRSTALAGDLVLVAAPFAALGSALAAVHLERVPTLAWPFVVVLGVGVAALAVVVDRRLDRVPARTLRESGSVASQAVGAMVSLDSRELGRALSDGTARATRRRLSRLRTARGPASALVTTDLVVLRRSTRHVVQLVVTALIPVLVSTVPQLASTAGVLLSLLVAGYVAQSATGEGARRAEMVPALDRLLPLEARTVRRLRMVVPAAVMALWSLVVFAAVGRWAGDVAGWMALGLAATPVWAAAAVRSAYRASPDWGAPLVSTPMGALPSGVGSVIARGPDVVVLGLLPVWIALLVRTVTPVMLGAQITCALIAVMVASSIHKGGLLERMMDASGEQAGRPTDTKR